MKEAAMEEDMEDTFEFTFTAIEIDLDYEFDAVRYFDFTLEELPAQSRLAELWFKSAASYPPSPFVATLMQRDDMLLENVTTSPKTKALETSLTVDCDTDAVMDPDFSAMDVNNRDCEATNSRILQDFKSSKLHKFEKQPEFVFKNDTRFAYNNHIKNESCKSRKTTRKPSFPRISTLMKPTVSQLAKQSCPQQVIDSRFQKLDKSDKSLNNSSGVETQASKRQKLDGGQLRKVAADTNQQINLVHKVPKKDTIYATGNNPIHTKLRLTVPRQPDLETAHRAQRTRQETSRERQPATTLTSHPFKARPLNRKILEAPTLVLPKRSSTRIPEFQEFHLKTSERAMQHASSVSSSSLNCNKPKVLQSNSAVSVAESGRESRRPNFVDDQKHNGGEMLHKFKALPLNKKIFSSKGDSGVFRNNKRETTVPMEFKFHTEKRAHHDPPVDLFNKLTLKAEIQANGGPTLRPFTLPKGSKENRMAGSFQQQSEIKQLLIGKSPKCAADGFSDDTISQMNPMTRINRSLGIR